MNDRPHYRSFAINQGHVRVTDVAVEDHWQVVCRFGARGDFFYANYLWWIRRALDWIAGGPSFRRARRHPSELRVGDVVDGWRVIAIQPEQQMTLLMEMRAPGDGVLEYLIREVDDGTELSVTAYWHPAGVWGVAYWWALLPFHAFLFRGTTRAIVKRAGATRS